MNTLEARIRQALVTRAGLPGARELPPRSIAAMRRRQGVFSLSVGAVIALFGLAMISVWSVAVPDGTQVAGDRRDPIDHPLERVPDDWPDVTILDPSEGYVNPSAERSIDAPRVVAYGTVNGERFSLSAWTQTGDHACLGIAGPGGDRFASPAPQPPSAWGGVVMGTCASAQGVPGERDLYLLGATGDVPLTANTGFVSGRVETLIVRTAEGTESEVRILRGSEGWEELRTFLFFPSEGFVADLVALDADGNELASTSICTDTDVSGGCAWPVEQLVPSEEHTR